MAITSPRVIFACTIPTIIVILSYIWFKKKKELSQKPESRCSRSNHIPVSIQQEIEEAAERFETLPLERLEPRVHEDTSISVEVPDIRPEFLDNDTAHIVNMVSDPVTKNRQNEENCPGTLSPEEREPLNGSTNRNANSSENSSPTAVQIEEVSQLIERLEETHINTTPDENSDAVISEGTDSLSIESNDTVVEGFDTSLVDTNVTIGTDIDSPSSPKEHISQNQLNQPTSNGRLSPTELENKLVNSNSAISEHPTAVSSPGSVDEPDHHKMTNGTDTSAYGSTSHSPAEELLESPTVSNYSDMHSEGSSDSGKGCGDIRTLSAEGSTTGFPLTPMSVFEFELPQELCGRLIGQKGRYVNYIKSKSRANISIKRHPFNSDLKLCAVIGTEEDINAALVVIRKRFPLSRFPCISMVQVNAPLLSNVPIPDTLQLHLPESVTCDVILSSLVNAGHFFVQQPTHPTYPSLGRLDQCMLHCYLNGMGAPELPKPVEAGVICAASTMGGWYRAQIVYVHPDADECEVRFVDYGGYSQEAISSLRQIRSDFMTLPFQASECYLANVVPVDETQGWTLEATSLFEELAQGQILLARIVTFSDDGIPYIHLYRVQGVMTTFINKELVTCGVAKWIEHQA